MTNTNAESEEGIAEVTRWFGERGFGIKFIAEEDGTFWAALTRLPSGNVVASMYGRGETEAGAARSAKERYEVEE